MTALKKAAASSVRIGVDVRRAVGDRAVARVLRIEDAHRVLDQPRLAVFRQHLLVLEEMLDQRGAPRVACLGIAQGVELERHALGDAELVEQLIGEDEQFDIRRGLGRADDLGVDLMELAEAALLGALVTEHRTRGGELESAHIAASPR